MTLQSHNRTLSVCIPLYNKVDTLAGVLDGILSQPYPFIEAIISDNGSTDGSTQIAREFAGRDPRVRYFRIEKTIPVMENFRYVISLAQGEFCKVQSADDSIHPDFVSAMLEPLLSNPAIDFTVCREEGYIGHSANRRDMEVLADILHRTGDFCKLLVETADLKSRARMIAAECWNKNSLGNIYKVIFRRACIPGQRWRQLTDSYPMQQAFFDWDFLVRLFLNHNGAFVDRTLYQMWLDDKGPFGRAIGDSVLQMAAAGQDLMIPFTLMTDPTLSALREGLTPQDRRIIFDYVVRTTHGMMDMALQIDSKRLPSTLTVPASN